MRYVAPEAPLFLLLDRQVDEPDAILAAHLHLLSRILVLLFRNAGSIDVEDLGKLKG